MWRVIPLVAVAAVVACYEPGYREGIACGEGRSCPAPFVCAADDTCRRSTGDGAEDPGDDADDPGDGDDDPGDGTQADAGAGGPADASLPDAALVDCRSDEDCQTPPTPCQQAGSCNPSSNTCEFPSIDCSSIDTTCTRGVCVDGSCVSRPRNDGATCADRTCGPFGPCGGFDGTRCDESGEQSRQCTGYTCQSGVCQGASVTERAACTIQVPDDPPCARPDVLCPACNYENDCAQTAPPITCTCVNYTCENDACSRGSSSCDQGCDRVTDGLSCLSGGAFGVCQSGVCIVPVNIDSNEASGPLCRTEPSAAR